MISFLFYFNYSSSYGVAEIFIECFYKMVVIYLCIHGKLCQWVYVIRIFKALLRFKKLRKSIDFHLAKYAFVSQRKLLFKFIWKIPNLKIKMS